MIDLAIMTAIGVVLALIGPLGTFRDPLAIRLIAWLLFCYIGYALYAPIDTVARRLAETLDFPVWVLRLAGVLLSSMPMAVIVWILPRWPDHVAWPGIEYAFEHYLYVVVIGGLITLATSIIQRAQEAGEPVSAPSTTANSNETAPRFLDRLPAALGSDLIALEMEDHYVRAHTALGSELILMRMRDAVAELGGMDGMQVHRSWWVARHAVEAVERDGRNIRLVLARGLEAPVSRANTSALKDAGWI